MQLVRVFLRAMLPYPDLLRRVRIRRAAWKLVGCAPWSEDDASGDDAAQLALLACCGCNGRGGAQ